MMSSPATVPITRSQRLARSVLRTKPTTCGNQVYFTGSDRSLPSTSAILFSKPSPFSSENGKLLGSAQTRSSLRATSSPVGDCAAPEDAEPASATAQSGASRRNRRHIGISQDPHRRGGEDALARLRLFYFCSKRSGRPRPAPPPDRAFNYPSISPPNLTPPSPPPNAA